jgi:hypothetical protein
MNQGTAIVIENVEQYAKRKFRYRNEIGILLRAAEDCGMISEFDQLSFTGKFIKNAHSILTRDNLDNSVTARLADELRVNLEKSAQSINTLIEKSPKEEKTLITGQFLNLTEENFQNLITLMMELSWFKNYSLDKTST